MKFVYSVINVIVLLLSVSHITCYTEILLNQHVWPVHVWFLEITFVCTSVCVHVYVCLCVALIISGTIQTMCDWLNKFYSLFTFQLIYIRAGQYTSI